MDGHFVDKFYDITPVLHLHHWHYLLFLLSPGYRMKWKQTNSAYLKLVVKCSGPRCPVPQQCSVSCSLWATSLASFGWKNLKTQERHVPRHFSEFGTQVLEWTSLAFQTAESVAAFKRRLITHRFTKHWHILSPCVSSRTGFNSWDRKSLMLVLLQRFIAIKSQWLTVS